MRSIALVGLALAACAIGWPASAITLSAVNRGYFRSDGRHITDNENTAAGFSGGRRYNGFAVFDLTAQAGTVTAATLHLEPDMYSGSFSSLTIDFFDVSATAAELNDTYIQPSTAGAVIHNDLGSGNVYATQVIVAANVDSVLAIPLNAQALSDLNAALSGHFALGMFARGANSSPDYFVRFGDDDEFETIELELEITPPVNDPDPEPDPDQGSENSTNLIVPEPAGWVLCGWLPLYLLMRGRRRMSRR